MKGMFSKTPHFHLFHLGLSLSLQWTLRETGDDPVISSSTQISTTLLKAKTTSYCLCPHTEVLLQLITA